MLANSVLSNFIAGSRLCLLRPVALNDFCFSLDQVVLLLVLDLTLVIIRGFLLFLPSPQFEINAFPGHGAGLICFLFAAYLLGRILNNKAAALQLTVIVYSTAPVFFLLQLGLGFVEKWFLPEFSTIYFGLVYLYIALLAVLVVRAVCLVASPMLRFALLGLAVFSLIWILPGMKFWEVREFWVESLSVDDGQKELYAEYKAFDAEQLMYRQADLLKGDLKAMMPGEAGFPDLYFVSFAGYAYQDVFSKEAAFAKRLFDHRFGTEARSIQLVNNLQTRDSIPLATATNLAISLRHIGRIMDADEDILVLYLTSHGSEKHELSVNFWPLPLNDLTPPLLKKILDASGIKWRVIIISACYSGGFVDAIKGPNTMVATASAADRTSFGCSNENEFTYFGEAIFKDQLPFGHSFLESFRRAASAIELREQQEDLPPSKPQLFVGSKIEKRLDRLVAQRCSDKQDKSIFC